MKFFAYREGREACACFARCAQPAADVGLVDCVGWTGFSFEIFSCGAGPGRPLRLTTRQCDQWGMFNQVQFFAYREGREACACFARSAQPAANVVLDFVISQK